MRTNVRIGILLEQLEQGRNRGYSERAGLLKRAGRRCAQARGIGVQGVDQVRQRRRNRRGAVGQRDRGETSRGFRPGVGIAGLQDADPVTQRARVPERLVSSCRRMPKQDQNCQPCRCPRNVAHRSTPGRDRGRI